MTQTITGKVAVHTGRVIQHLGGIYLNEALELIAQLVENSRDSEAQDIWCVLEPNKIVIADNGSGMIDDVLPQDRETIGQFRQRVASGELSLESDVRLYVGEASRHSLVWMMENIGYSSKGGGEKGKLGVRGIGFQGVYSLGKNIIVYTRPKMEYASDRWPGVSQDAIKVWKLTPPSGDQLSRTTELNYEISQLGKQLRNPFGNLLTSGTVVEISDLLEGVIEQLRPGALVSYLSGRFGEDIRRGLKIMVIDHVTTSRKNGEREMHVQAPEYKGVSIVQKTLHLGKGTLPFDVNLFFVSKGKAKPVMLRRMGSEVSPLADIPEFNHAPWTLLTGTVDFPVLEDFEAWNTSKTHLLASKFRSDWVKKLLTLSDQIEGAIKQSRDRIKARELEDYAKNAAAAVNLALSEVQTFEDVVVRPTHVHRSKIKKVAEPEVVVLVRNQYGRLTKVEGLKVQLFLSGMILHYNDLIGGRFSFGQLEEGAYSVVLTLPHGMSIKGDPRRSFRVNPSNQSHQIIYQITTEEKEPEKRSPTPKIMPILDSFGTPEPAYANWLHVGQVRINIDADPFPSIIGDRQKMDLVFAERMASALTEYTLSGPTDFLFQERSKLFVAILRNLNRL